MKLELAPETRDAVRESVRQVLTLVGGELEVDEAAHGVPGDAGEIYDHVDGLVRIARRTRGDDVATYLAQLPAEVCHDCRHQFENGFCPLRHRRMCALQVAATPVFEAIGGALRNLNDPEYCAAHDAAPTDAEESAGGCGRCQCGGSTFFG
jgi:hypothetical protein